MSSDTLLLVGLVGVSLLLLVVLIVVAIVRGMRQNASGKRRGGSSAARGGNGVQVITHGRDGEVLYTENGKTCRFYWEFLGGDAMIGVSFPRKDQWDAAIPWAAGRQEEIMQKVAREFVRREAPGHKVRWADGSFDIL